MRSLIALALFAPAVALAAPQTAELAGEMKFVSDAPLEKIVGTASGAGALTVDLDDMTTLQATITVPVASMKTGNDQRDDHLRSPEWLDAAQFAEITFVASAAKVTKPTTGDDVKEAEVEVTGKFTLHGVSTDMTAPATLKWKGDKLKITTKFQVKLDAYNIKGRDGVVGSKVGTNIDVDVSLKGVLKPVAPVKAAGIIAIVLGLGVGGVWLASGMHLATQTEKLVETRTTDEFGDEVVDRKWEKTFELGLDFAGPGGGGLVGLGGVLLFLARRRRKAA